MGRYVQADPIGLEGGINTFLYADSNPVIGIDPDGLSSFFFFRPGPVFRPIIKPPPVAGPKPAPSGPKPNPNPAPPVIPNPESPDQRPWRNCTDNDADNPCEKLGMYGPFYRHELNPQNAYNTQKSGYLYGNAPQGGFTPTVQAFRKKLKDPYLEFCTPIKPQPGGGPIVGWYYGITPGVSMAGGSARIPVLVTENTH